MATSALSNILSPREQLSDIIDDLDALIKQLFENLFVEKKSENLITEKTTTLVDLFTKKELEFTNALKTVPAHQEREQYIRTLEKSVQFRDNLIKKLASELKFIETSLAEATYQAEKKLKSVHQSEMNRVFSEDVIHLAHLISKSYSVSSSVYWQQGDPTRPFPTEADFAASALKLMAVEKKPKPFPHEMGRIHPRDMNMAGALMAGRSQHPMTSPATSYWQQQQPPGGESARAFQAENDLKKKAGNVGQLKISLPPSLTSRAAHPQQTIEDQQQVEQMSSDSSSSSSSGDEAS